MPTVPGGCPLAELDPRQLLSKEEVKTRQTSGNGNPLPYYGLGNSMSRGTWPAIAHRVAELDTTEWLSVCVSAHRHTHTHTHDHQPAGSSQSAGVYVLVGSMLLLLLSHFSRVQLCAAPEMAAHQAPPSLGLSRQGHWSGLPFPSPMHESEK